MESPCAKEGRADGERQSRKVCLARSRSVKEREWLVPDQFRDDQQIFAPPEIQTHRHPECSEAWDVV
jgi:hypothetical protein